MSGGSSGSTQVVKNDPPAYAQPYHEGLLKRAHEFSAQPWEPYPGPRIAGFTDDQLQSQQMVRGQSGMNQALSDTSRGELNKTLSGGYLGNNPYLQDAVNYGQSQVMKNYGAQLGRNFGNSGVNQEVGQGMGQVSASLYDNERNRMMAAQNQVPGAMSASYIPSQALNLVGAENRQLQQNINDLGYQQFQEALNHPYKGLETMGSALNLTGGYGQQTSPNPYQPNPVAGALGGAASGYALGSAAGGAANGAAWGPWGALIGAGLGYLGSR